MNPRAMGIRGASTLLAAICIVGGIIGCGMICLLAWAGVLKG